MDNNMNDVGVNHQWSNWTIEHDKIFESGLVDFPEGSLNRWENLANLFSPVRTPEEMRARYDVLVRDVSEILAGCYDYLLYGYMSQVEPVLPRNSGGESSSSPASSSGTAKPPAHATWTAKGKSWTEDEHRRFLIGLERYGKGDWRNISRICVKTRSPGQVASHAQKYFIRQDKEKAPTNTTRKKRSSIHDITTPHGGGSVGSTVHDITNTNPVLGHDHQNLPLDITATTTYSINPCPPPSMRTCNVPLDYTDHDHQNLPLNITATTYFTSPCPPPSMSNCNAPPNYPDHDHQNLPPLNITATTYSTIPCLPPSMSNCNAPPNYTDHDHQNLPLNITDTTYPTGPCPPPFMSNCNAPLDYLDHDQQNLPMQITTTYCTDSCPPPPLTNPNAPLDYPSQAGSYTNFPFQGGYDNSYTPTTFTDLPPLPINYLSDNHNFGFEVTINNLLPCLSDYPDQGGNDLSIYDYATTTTNDTNLLSSQGNFLGEEGDDLINFDIDFTGV